MTQAGLAQKTVATSFEALDKVDHIDVEVSAYLLEFGVIETTLAGFVRPFERLGASKS
jgi:hypothetical protein